MLCHYPSSITITGVQYIRYIHIKCLCNLSRLSCTDVSFDCFLSIFSFSLKHPRNLHVGKPSRNPRIPCVPKTHCPVTRQQTRQALVPVRTSTQTQTR